MKNLKIYKAISTLCLGTVLVTGCATSYEPKENTEVIEITKPTTINTTQKVVLVTEIKEPTNEEEKEKIKAEIEQNNATVFAYQLRQSDTQLTEEILQYALKKDPSLQFYLIDNGLSLEEHYQNYPNVTYVKKNETLEESLQTHYTSNEICSILIKDLRIATNYGKEKIQKFDLDKTINELKKIYQNIDRKEIEAGVNKFYNYVSNTELFKKTEHLSEQTMIALKPYVEKVIPTLEETYETYQPIVKEKYEEEKTKIKQWIHP